MSKLTKWTREATKAISNVVPHQHSADRRAANQAVADQIDYYNKAKDALATETARTESEREENKKKIGEKQIKSMQRAYRSPGFMEEASSDLTNKLG